MTEYQAGRELDALIAERVMGRPVVQLRRRGAKAFEPMLRATGGLDDCGDYSAWYTKNGERLYCGAPWAPVMVPNYSTEIAAAWEVVEKMCTDHRVEVSHWTDGWYCKITHLDSGRSFKWDQAETAPLAICRAALAAVGASSAGTEEP